MVSNNIASIVDNQPPFSAGSLKHCVHAWAEITSDPFILDAVTHCHIEFDVLPGSEINNKESLSCRPQNPAKSSHQFSLPPKKMGLVE